MAAFVFPYVTVGKPFNYSLWHLRNFDGLFHTKSNCTGIIICTCTLHGMGLALLAPTPFIWIGSSAQSQVYAHMITILSHKVIGQHGIYDYPLLGSRTLH